MFVRLAAACALFLAFSGPAAAQWGDFLKDKLNQEAKNKAGQVVQESGDAAYEGAKGSGKKDGKSKPAAEQNGAAEQASSASGKKGEGGAPQAAKDEVAAGEVYGNKFDFIPGDKVLLFDDFVETDVGDYPARWTVKGGGGGNAVEVVSYKGQKWFKAIPAENYINGDSLHFLRYDPKGDFPKKFTIEFDTDMGGLFSILFATEPDGSNGPELTFNADEISTTNVKTPIKPYGRVMKHISISVNGTYLKAYVGGARVVQDPDAVTRPIARIAFRFVRMWGRPEHGEDTEGLKHQMFTNFRLAEGGKDVAQALNTEGRIVVHGIYFDTGSDVIKPESGGALRNILTLLQDDAGLRFRIEGHTDNQGGDAVNGPLSEKRAAAVKAWLQAQGIDPKRLESKGFGATKPMDSNGTQEGRANNRRVEFVKL